MQKEILQKLGRMMDEKVSSDVLTYTDPLYIEGDRFILENHDMDKRIGGEPTFSDLNRYSPHILYADMLLQEYFGKRTEGAARDNIDKIYARMDEIINLFEESKRNPKLYSSWEDRAIISTDSWTAFLKDPKGRRSELLQIPQKFSEYLAAMPEIYRQIIELGSRGLMERSQGSWFNLDYAGALTGRLGLQDTIESIEGSYRNNPESFGQKPYLHIGEATCRSRIGYLTMDWARLVATDVLMRGWREYVAAQIAHTERNGD